MAVSSGTSFILSSILTVLLFSSMQIYRQWLASSQLHTILGGYLGSVLFILGLTMTILDPCIYLFCICTGSIHAYMAVGNLETALFGKNFQTKLFPEVILCLAIAMTASGMVHRVCTTTCLVFSVVGLYYINRISQQTYTVPIPVQPVVTKKKK